MLLFWNLKRLWDLIIITKIKYHNVKLNEMKSHFHSIVYISMQEQITVCCITVVIRVLKHSLHEETLRPLNSTRRHRHFLSICDIEPSDMRIKINDMT